MDGPRDGSDLDVNESDGSDAALDGPRDGSDLDVSACVGLSCPKRVFVTSKAYDGALGGLVGADAKCQGHADSAHLGGTYLAWLSDSSASPSTRFTRSTTPYVRIDGAVVASNWIDLTDGLLAHAIDMTETGGAPPKSTVPFGGATCNTWSNSDTTGVPLSPGSDCSDWTSSSGTVGRWGNNAAVDSDWTVRCSMMGPLGNVVPFGGRAAVLLRAVTRCVREPRARRVPRG